MDALFTEALENLLQHIEQQYEGTDAPVLELAQAVRRQMEAANG